MAALFLLALRWDGPWGVCGPDGWSQHVCAQIAAAERIILARLEQRKGGVQTCAPARAAAISTTYVTATMDILGQIVRLAYVLWDALGLTKQLESTRHIHWLSVPKWDIVLRLTVRNRLLCAGVTQDLRDPRASATHVLIIAMDMVAVSMHELATVRHNFDYSWDGTLHKDGAVYSYTTDSQGLGGVGYAAVQYAWDYDMMHGCICDKGHHCNMTACFGNARTTLRPPDKPMSCCSAFSDDGSRLDGTMTLNFKHETTIPIGVNATGNDAKAALEALSVIRQVTVEV